MLTGTDSSGISVSSILYLFTVLVFNAGLLMVDHVHFQYNGMLFGLLLLCVDFALCRYYLGLAFAFSALVCSKHLFVYLAPVFGLYLLRNYCFETVEVHDQSHRSARHNSAHVWPSLRTFKLFRFATLAAVACIPVSIAFGPFLIQTNGGEQLLQIFRRLFPFGRGLVHAYWAPNVWTLYCALDKVLSVVVTKIFRVALAASSAGLSSTAGLTGDFRFLVLPSVSPLFSLLAVLVTQMPAWWRLWVDPRPSALLPCLVYCSLCAYALGYHVHEKAILISQVLALFVALRNERSFVIFSLLSVVGVYSLMPLLFPLYETPIKGEL